MTLAHDYPPQVVSGWTLYQLRMMTCPECELSGSVKMTSMEFAGFIKQRQLEKSLRKPFRGFGG